ncbi:MAG TPA: Rv3235 family protein [Micromonosporaceae bacterium]
MPRSLAPRPHVDRPAPTSVVRVRPAPALEPPFDYEAAGWAFADPRKAPCLPLDWAPRVAGGRAEGRRPAPHRPVPTRPVTPPPSEGRQAAQRFVRACVEVLNGYRPAAHLRAMVEPASFSSVADQLTGGRRAPSRATGGPSGAPPVRVRRMRVCEPRAGVAEAAVVLGRGELAWAVALRFERRPDGWRCAFVQVV